MKTDIDVGHKHLIENSVKLQVIRWCNSFIILLLKKKEIRTTENGSARKRSHLCSALVLRSGIIKGKEKLS